MDEKILEHLKLLTKYVNYLNKIAKVSKDDYLKDFILKGSSERYLQLAIESCINIGNRIISLVQFKEPVSTPETYADIFIELSRICIMPREFVNNLVKMVKFRNRLVHIYWEVDAQEVYNILQNNLVDFDRFKEVVVDCLKKINHSSFPE